MYPSSKGVQLTPAPGRRAWGFLFFLARFPIAQPFEHPYTLHQRITM